MSCCRTPGLAGLSALPGPDVLPVLEQLLGDPSKRAAVGEAYTARPGANAAVIVQLLTDDSAQVREQAAFGIILAKGDDNLTVLLAHPPRTAWALYKLFTRPTSPGLTRSSATSGARQTTRRRGNRPSSTSRARQRGGRDGTTGVGQRRSRAGPLKGGRPQANGMTRAHPLPPFRRLAARDGPGERFQSHGGPPNRAAGLAGEGVNTARLPLLRSHPAHLPRRQCRPRGDADARPRRGLRERWSRRPAARRARRRRTDRAARAVGQARSPVRARSPVEGRSFTGWRPALASGGSPRVRRFLAVRAGSGRPGADRLVRGVRDRLLGDGVVGQPRRPGGRRSRRCTSTRRRSRARATRARTSAATSTS